MADQLEDDGSLYRYYCDVLALRHRHPAIARGDYKALVSSEKNFGGFLITYGEETLLLLHNTGTEEISFDISRFPALEGMEFSGISGFVGMGDAKLSGTTLTLGPQTSVVIK